MVDWSRRVFAICAMIGAAAAMFMLPLFASHADHALKAHAQEPSLRPMCALWDEQASEAIARRVQESHGDVDLRQLGDSIFRMRRARRSCEMGWVRIACQDYHAIMRNIAGTSAEWPGSVSLCPLGMADGATVSIP